MKHLICLAACLLVIAGCKKSDDPNDNGKIQIVFSHRVNGNPLVLDTLIYQTATLHNYKVTDLQYFISDITLYHDGGKQVTLSQDEGIHYVDARIPSTLAWSPDDEIAPGTYDSLSFTFGIDAVKNVSNRFPNPPERDMAWPDILGGGYHYMKMNLMYKNAPAATTQPFMFHLGIGQIYSSAVPNPDSITGYVQNYFPVTLKNSFTIAEGAIRTIQCTMLVDRWFDGTETFDFTDYPGGIMQYQEGMHRACLNGRNAFTGSILN
jgi:hypothetical protein